MIRQFVTLPGADEPVCLDLPLMAGPDLFKMPVVHRILLENVIRHDPEGAAGAIKIFSDWLATGSSEAEIVFLPNRILMHDTTCGPALTDIAAMRDVVAETGGDPTTLNPLLPVATSTDHSLAVDVYGRADAVDVNMTREMERNAERYRFMKWASRTVDGFRVFPPGSGIMHTINMERLATVTETARDETGRRFVFPDTLVGTDSHTPMINAMGVLGWGVGGIEAEGVMFGVPTALRLPDVIGVRLTGSLPDGVLATDLALVVTQKLRQMKVAGEFVEFFGPGVSTLSVGQRSAVANMAPEYGATTGFFPVDDATLVYLRQTGRNEEAIALVAAQTQAQGLWFDPGAEPRYTRLLDIDLSTLRATLAGPRRPQDALDLADAPGAIAEATADVREGPVPADAVAIAAITSCTNTTDTGLLIAAGLVARNARRRGLTPPAWVKTSLTPGSPAAAARLERVGLLPDLEACGFAIAGYGCATCIGNSGPLPDVVNDAIAVQNLKAIAVLSGNRNFPGRVHTQVDLGFLASPPLVVAFALAGRVLDLSREPVGTDADGGPVMLSELWPSGAEIDALMVQALSPDDVEKAYGAAERSAVWQALEAPSTARFPWSSASTYLRPPRFVREGLAPVDGDQLVARPLMVLGDDITTDHISPAGAIPAGSDAAAWLVEHGEDPLDLNVYSSRRGNWEVMLRGLYTNRNVVNLLGADLKAGKTRVAGRTDPLPVWRAAGHYESEGVQTAVVAGERYGTGSSRDWAAKGLRLLGVRVLLANSLERIHRSNLIGMGILPLRLPDGWRPDTLGLTPESEIVIDWRPEAWSPRCEIEVRIVGPEGVQAGVATAFVETEAEVALLHAGGMISRILQRATA